MTGCLLTNLDIENPGTAANTHFTYYVYVDSPAADAYKIYAIRNTYNGGTLNQAVTLWVAADGKVTRTGTGAFTSIK